MLNLKNTFVSLTAMALFIAFTLPANGKQLVIGHSSLPVALGNPLKDTSHSGGFVFGTVYDRLTISDKDGAKPALLTSWKVNADDKTKWTFKLRQGVKFHNGNDLTSSDVVSLINWLASDEGKVKAANTVRNLRNLKGAEVIDDYTLIVQSKKPDPLLPSLLGIIKQLDWEHVQDVTFDAVGKNPNGTGPYSTVSWTQDKVEVKKFNNGWRPGKIDSISFRFLPELSARMAAFESNQIDLAFQMVADNKAKTESSNGKLILSPGTAVSTLHFYSNQKGVPISDVRVRQALNYGVNMQEYVDTMIGGATKVSGQPGTPNINGYFDSIRPYPYNPEKAKSLLTAAGYGNGVEIIAESVVAQGDWKDIVQFVSSDLKKIGVTFTVRPITLPDLIARVRDPSKFKDATVFSFNYGSEPTMDIMRSINGLHSCKSFMKWTCFEEIEGEISAANTEFNPTKRRQHLKNIAQYYHNQAASIFLFESFDLDSVKNYVKDYRPINRLINWHEVRLEGK
ncbi:ABC transporter substrate-binding protein [Alphaproteobacteria bacterium]|nr:ABC transporter substrate-binding protein [Alphaproteobacteria bacterium]